MQNSDSPRKSPLGSALVTGAGTRIGASLAKGLAAMGYAVAVHYNASRENAEDLAAQLNAKGYRAKLVCCDLANRADRANLIAEAVDKVGALSVLVNNASIYEPDSVETLDEALWDRHFALHTEAPMFLARDFARQLPHGASGNIINMIDARVLDLSPSYTSYTLSKAALHIATRTLAQSLAPRIRVNAIGPGPTLPEAGQSDEDFARRVSQLPLGQHPTLDEMVGALRFILSTQSMTGQMVALDGGSHLVWPERSAPTPRRS